MGVLCARERDTKTHGRGYQTGEGREPDQGDSALSARAWAALPTTAAAIAWPVRPGGGAAAAPGRGRRKTRCCGSWRLPLPFTESGESVRPTALSDWLRDAKHARGRTRRAMRRLGGRSLSPAPTSLLVSDSPRIVHAGRGARQGGQPVCVDAGLHGSQARHCARLRDAFCEGANPCDTSRVI